MSETNTQEAAQESVPFAPHVPSADAVDLAAVIRRGRDQKNRAAKVEKLALEMEVLVPGLPNGNVDKDGNDEYGLKCKVLRFTGFQSGQIVYEQRQAAQPDDGKLFAVPEEFSSADARAGWWRDIWRLMYGLHPSTKRLLVALHTGKSEVTAEMFTVSTAIYWMRCAESDLVTQPLLQGINVLNYYSKEAIQYSGQLDEFKVFPEVLNQLKTAFRGGFLADFLSGDPEVVELVVENVQMLTELQVLVANEDAALMARYNKDAVKQAIREVLAEYYEMDPPFPTNEMNLFNKHPEALRKNNPEPLVDPDAQKEE